MVILLAPFSSGPYTGSRSTSTAGRRARRPRAGTLPLVKHDIPDHDARIRLNIRGCGQYLRDQTVLVRADVLQQEISVVQRLPGEIHLCDHAVDLARHLEVKMRRPHPVGSSWIRSWL